ncbi:efflux RND transporter permease subunit [Candidatus Omnitrophota bacterium]
MKERVINFFLKRHLLANLVFVTVFVGGILAWIQIPKEELPDITFDTVRATVNYPGASTEEVEYYVTRPIEEELRGLDGIYRITSSTGVGTCRVTVELEQNYADKNEAISEIRNAVLDVDLPDDIIDDPNIRVFKTSKKAIIDIGLFLENEELLDVASRQKLQSYALALENRLLSLPEISSVNRSGYLKDEIHIKVDPEKLIEYRIPFNTVIQEIQDNNVRQPAGSIENVQEPKVTLSAELNTIPELEDLAVQGGFEGQVIRLKDIARIAKGYEKTKTVVKINGKEGIFLNVVKSSRVGILEAIRAVRRVADDFSSANDAVKNMRIVTLDDESYDVRNRLSLIGINGAIGFGLILVMLFIFLDLRSGLWVAMGIPFTLCFTLIAALLSGYTVNNITLAAFIIVMGMVVDDAIVVSENISRLRRAGAPAGEAALRGTAFVFLPIVASIATTCVAFLPLLFFTGRFGAMVTFIPPIVIFMLGGSLLEALFILPGHLTLRMGGNISHTGPSSENKNKHWFDRCESAYGKLIERALPLKWIVFAVFIGLLIVSGFVATSKMKFVMFPGEETREIHITAETPSGTSRYETAHMAQPLENILLPYIGKEVVGLRNEIAKTRRGSAAQENKMRLRVEIVPKEKRKKSANQLIEEWKKLFSPLKQVKNVQFRKTWHGQGSGSPIEILVKENNDSIRQGITDKLALLMEEHPALKNVEIDRPVMNPEYKLTLDRDKIRRLAISPADIAKTLRAALEGKILYDFMGDDEEVYVRLTTIGGAKDHIDKVLSIPVENEAKYLVPLSDIVSIEEVEKPDSLIREDLKRTTSIDADIKPESNVTPIEIARYFEDSVFKELTSRHPSTILEFAGEVKDTRESRKDFSLAIIMAIVFIYIVLTLLFNSLSKPLIVMVAIPFGVVGIILAFWLHGISMYGFFAVIGALGLSGVVINDAIIMLVKLDNECSASVPLDERNSMIARVAQTRLRAVILTTLTTVAGIIPTAYGWAGYDAMLAQMMLALAWGLFFGTMITLILIPCIYSLYLRLRPKPALAPVGQGAV